MYNVTSKRVEGKGQTVDYIEHGWMQTNGTLRANRGRHTLRVRIHADTYAFQSYGVVERWDGKQWHEVARVRGEALMVEDRIGYKDGAGERELAFRADATYLRQLAEEVL